MVLLVFFFNMKGVNAQVPLAPKDIVSTGSFDMALTQIDSFDTNKKGPQTTWDFSHLKAKDLFNFRQLEYDGKRRGNFANIVQVNPSDTMEFYRKLENDVYTIYKLLDFDRYEYKNLKNFHFPIALNDTCSDSFTFSQVHPGYQFGLNYDSVRYTFSMSSKNICDAWGSFTLPMGTYNAMRFHEHLKSGLKLYAKNGNDAFQLLPGYTEIDISETYSWYTQNKGFALATFYPEYMEMEYMVSSTLGVSSPQVSIDFEMDDVVYSRMKIDNVLSQSFEIEVYNLEGKRIHKELFEAEKNASVDCSNWIQGMYACVIKSKENGQVYCKRVLKMD